MSSTAIASRWTYVRPGHALEWDSVLWHQHAHLFQLAYWNEAYRDFYGRPLYLRLGNGETIDASATVVTFGVPGFRVGLLQRGPALMNSYSGDLETAIQSLATTLRAAGVFCLRITNPDASVLDRIARASHSVRDDPFPWLTALQHEGFVSLEGEESAILGRFQAQIRQQIGRSARSGLTVESSADGEDLKRYWYLFEDTSNARGFLRRPLSSFLSLFATNRHSAGRVELSVVKSGARAIGALILARDATTTYYVGGGRDESISKEFAYTAHYRIWVAMLSARAAGSTLFNLGSVQGPVGVFKRKFAPEVRVNPPPVTLILSPMRYRLWMAATQKNNQARRLVDVVRRVAARQ